jgi:hypothetical protein
MRFLAEENELTVTFEGWEIFWALKRKLVIPREQIAELSWQPEYVLARRMLRVAGTDVPGLLWAGRFVGGGKRDFLYVQRPSGVTWGGNRQPMKEVLVVDLQNNRYDQVIVSCRPDVGAQLTGWFRGN